MKVNGDDFKVITMSILGICLVIFAGMCLWFAVQGSMIAGVALTAILFGGGFLVAQRATVNNNAADNAQLIAALTQRDQLPADGMYKVLKARAEAEERVHRANRSAIQTADSIPAPVSLPAFDTNGVILDID